MFPNPNSKKHKVNIFPTLYVSFVFLSCVQTNQCDGDGIFDTRGAEKFTCEDNSQICCHQSKLKVKETDRGCED